MLNNTNIGGSFFDFIGLVSYGLIKLLLINYKI